MSLGSDGRRLRSSLLLSSVSVPLVEQTSGKRWDGSDLGHVARKCFGTKWYSDVPGGAEYPRW